MLPWLLAVAEGSYLTAENDFSLWMTKYGKAYESETELLHRKSAWVQNKLRVARHNAMASKGEETFFMALNHLADLTSDEYEETLNYQHQPSIRGASAPDFVQGTPPASLDWKDSGAITDVKNQGKCG